MEEFASAQETQMALEKMAELQAADPNKLSGILNKYGNPFTSWPLRREPTEAFLRFFETPEAQQETEPGSQKNINPRLRELIDTFDKEIGEARAGRVKASTAAKKYVNAFLKQARGLQPPQQETQVPASMPEMEGETVPVERVQQAAGLAIQHPGPPEEKEMFFHALISFSSEQPNKTVRELEPRADAVTQASRILTSQDGGSPIKTSFSVLATNNFQKVAATIFDVVIPNETTREAIVSRIALEPLGAIVNHPDSFTGALQTITERWGENFVESTWFTQLRTDTNRLMTDQKGAIKIKSGFTNFASDLATTIFRSPLDPIVLFGEKTATPLGKKIITYMDAYRLAVIGGAPVSVLSMGQIAPLSPAPRRNNPIYRYFAMAGFGAETIVASGGMVGIIATNTRGAQVLVGNQMKRLAFTTLGSISSGIAGGIGGLNSLVNKGVGLFKNLIQKNKQRRKIDIWIIAGVAALIFFVVILPMWDQDMINTSLATHAGGADTGGPIGPVTSSCAKTTGIYLSQDHASYSSDTYGCSPCTIASSACGPTSDTMILNAFGSSATVPATVNKIVSDNHYCGYCASTDLANINLLAGGGLRVSSGFTSCADASNYLKACGLILAQGTHLDGNIDHYIVITGVSCDTNDQVSSFDALDPVYSWNIGLQSQSIFKITTMYGVVNSTK